MDSSAVSIAVFGICASGKSTVVQRLQELGFNARSCAQEHSVIPNLCTKLEPDVLVVLDCGYEAIKQRRNVQWGLERIAIQKERLRDALENCDLYLKSDYLTIEETVARIIQFLDTQDEFSAQISASKEVE